jgi:hypothetical protein
LKNRRLWQADRGEKNSLTAPASNTVGESLHVAG